MPESKVSYRDPAPRPERFGWLQRLFLPGNDMRTYTLAGLPIALALILSTSSFVGQSLAPSVQTPAIIRQANQVVMQLMEPPQMESVVMAAEETASVASTDTPEVATEMVQTVPQPQAQPPELAVKPDELLINRVRTYRVQSGDTLSAIARTYNVSVNTILSSNSDINADLIRIGTKLLIPPVDGLLYTVTQGEMLDDIARAHKADVNQIIEANGLQEPFTLNAGQRLLLPNAEKQASTASAATAPTNLGNTASVVKQINPSSAPGAHKAPAKGAATGKFVWPSPGWISTYFKEEDFPGHYHAGIDIANNYNTPIRAADGGIVILAEYYGNYGNCVIIDHGNGFVTWYGHFTRLYVSKGQQVERGEVLGPMGSTGKSSGPHLHFELHLNGKLVNPLSYLP